jgi:hypothetical protein
MLLRVIESNTLLKMPSGWGKLSQEPEGEPKRTVS